MIVKHCSIVIPVTLTTHSASDIKILEVELKEYLHRALAGWISSGVDPQYPQIHPRNAGAVKAP